MASFKIGDKVRAISAEAHEDFPNFYPKVGVVGEIKDNGDSLLPLVQWSNGTTSYNGLWYADADNLELVIS